MESRTGGGASSSGGGGYDVRELIEHNDDLIAAIVENLQLGRLDSCMKVGTY